MSIIALRTFCFMVYLEAVSHFSLLKTEVTSCSSLRVQHQYQTWHRVYAH